MSPERDSFGPSPPGPEPGGAASRIMKKILLLLAGVALLAAVISWYSHAGEILDLVTRWAMDCRGFVQQHPVLAWTGMLAVGSAIINLPIPVAALLKLMAGFMFGVAGGFGLNVCMSVAGGLIGFVFARHFFYHSLYSRYSHQLAHINLEIARNGFWYVLCSRLVVVTPFFVVNMLAGLSCIRKRKFLLGTLLGVLPSSTIYAVSGSKLHDLATANGLLSTQTVAILAVAGVLAVIPAVLNRKKKKHP